MAQLIQCTHCGQTFDLDLYCAYKGISKRMRAERLCFDCAYWKGYIENPTPGTAIVSGALYVFTPDRREIDRRNIRKRGITFAHDMTSKEIVTCIAPVFKARVPATFSEMLPDQYRFISADTYFRIKEYCAPYCNSKGCFDRYHCFWYHPEISEPHGPWNHVPKKYTVGSEMCESFINKEEMYVNL